MQNFRQVSEVHLKYRGWNKRVQFEIHPIWHFLAKVLTIASFGGISNGTPRHLLLFAIIQPQNQTQSYYDSDPVWYEKGVPYDMSRGTVWNSTERSNKSQPTRKNVSFGWISNRTLLFQDLLWPVSTALYLLRVVLRVNGTLDRLVRIKMVHGYLIKGLFKMSKIVSKFD